MNDEVKKPNVWTIVLTVVKYAITLVLGVIGGSNL